MNTPIPNYLNLSTEQQIAAIERNLAERGLVREEYTSEDWAAVMDNEGLRLFLEAGGDRQPESIREEKLTALAEEIHAMETP